MSLRSQYRRILAGIVPAGAVGASLLIGSGLVARANEEPARLEPRSFQPLDVADWFLAVRQAVSDVASGQSARPADRDLRLTWGNWWRNWGWGWRRPWGWGWPNWNNWRNWHNWPNWWRNW